MWALGLSLGPDPRVAALSPVLCPLHWACRNSWLCLVCGLPSPHLPAPAHGYRLHPSPPFLYLFDPFNGNWQGEKLDKWCSLPFLAQKSLSFCQLLFQARTLFLLLILISSFPSSSLPMCMSSWQEGSFLAHLFAMWGHKPRGASSLGCFQEEAPLLPACQELSLQVAGSEWPIVGVCCTSATRPALDWVHYSVIPSSSTRSPENR